MKVKKWEFYKIHTKETRKGWPIYLYPVITVEYTPEKIEEYSGGYEHFLKFGIGIRFLSYSKDWYIIRRVTSEE